MTQRTDEIYGPFRIIAGIRDKAPQAVAYLGSRAAYRTEAESPDAAASALKDLIDAIRVERQAKRVDGVPTADEYRDALAGLLRQLDPVILDQLRHHVRFGPGTTMEALAKATRQSEEEAERRYARLGRHLGRVLDFSPRVREPRGHTRHIFTFATATTHPHDSARWWELRREAAEGFVTALADGG